MARHILTTILILSCFLVNAQNNSPIVRAEKLRKAFAYSDAIPLYQIVLDKTPNNTDALRGIAECYRMNNQTEQAETHYRSLMNTGSANTNDKLHMAQMCMANANYNDAQKYFTEYVATASNDDRAKNQLSAIGKLNELLKDSVRFQLTPSNMNTPNSDFCPVRFADGFVIVSSRQEDASKGKTHTWTGDPFLSLYYAKGDLESKPSVSKFANELRSVYNDGPVSFNPQGDEAFFTRNNSKTPFRNDKTVRLKIVVSKLADGKWGEPLELPFNRAQYNTAHACLSKDGTRLYFSSDMPGGSGGMDIYYSDRNANTWSEPVNMGKAINTSGNEVFPYVGPDGLFYFSSDGWPGLGGLDLFKTDLNQSNNEPQNPGYPLNTHKDDFGIWLSSDLKTGLISSNRKGGMGDDDIWNIRFVNKMVIFGVVAEKQTRIPIPNAVVYLKDEFGNTAGVSTSDSDGNYSVVGEFNTKYTITTNPDGYFAGSETFSTANASNDSMRVDLLLEKIIINKPIVLENIYYDLDKWNIRPDAALELDKLVAILKDNPKIIIELGSHTDSRAPDNYNMTLSDKRAKSAADYIVKIGGIDPTRITGKGYGESMLVNGCKNNVKCSEADHQKNRRTEFKVISQ
jgi:outer membrane protein OmpA-like peptidoglycan-associated protein